MIGPAKSILTFYANSKNLLTCILAHFWSTARTDKFIYFHSCTPTCRVRHSSSPDTRAVTDKAEPVYESPMENPAYAELQLESREKYHEYQSPTETTNAETILTNERTEYQDLQTETREKCHEYQNPRDAEITQTNGKSTTETQQYQELQEETREKATDYQSLTGTTQTETTATNEITEYEVPEIGPNDFEASNPTY